MFNPAQLVAVSQPEDHGFGRAVAQVVFPPDNLHDALAVHALGVHPMTAHFVDTSTPAGMGLALMGLEPLVACHLGGRRRHG